MTPESDRWREATASHRHHRGCLSMIRAGDALAAANDALERELEARAGRTKFLEHAIASWKQEEADWIAEREARDRRIAELEAGLREILNVDPVQARRIARDLLAGRAAGGEG